jgi:cobalt-zinc-cadmium efflux system outer membrane protein
MINKHNFNNMNKFILSIFWFLTIASYAFGQTDTISPHINLTYKDYISRVMSGNLEYVAEKYNANIADAQIEAARVIQNPTLSVDWAGNNEDESMNEYALTTELSKTFELGQKRKARINLAKSEKALINASLANYLQNLQADATLDFLDALKQNYLFREMQDSYQMMKRLADADSLRLSLGSIKAIDAAQSKIEAGVLLNDLFQIEAERRNSFINLSTATGTFHADTLFFPVGRFNKHKRRYDISELITTALKNRADLLLAQKQVNYTQNALTLTRKERKTDLDFKVGASNSYLDKISSSPASTEIYAGIAVPL